MKKRIITLTLSILAVVLLVGVGFASWVVSQGASDEQTGNILVEVVKDERLDVTLSAPSGAFQFGAPANASEGWLHEDGDANALLENLEVTFTLEVTRPTAFALSEGQPTGLQLTPTLADVILDADDQEVAYPTKFFAPAATAVAFGTNAAHNDSTWTMSNNDKTATTTIVVKLQWGSLFGNDNPYDYFNAQSVGEKIGADVASAAGLAGIDADSTWGDLALAALNAVLAYNNYKFKLTVAVQMA